MRFAAEAVDANRSVLRLCVPVDKLEVAPARDEEDKEYLSESVGSWNCFVYKKKICSFFRRLSVNHLDLIQK